MRYLLILSCWLIGPALGQAEMPGQTGYIGRTRHLPAATRSIDRTPYWLACPALVTAYSPHDPLDSAYVLTKGKDRWRTSTGVDVRATPYGLAVDPQAIPYDTHVVVPGYRRVSAPNAVYRPDDTGGRMRQSWAKKRLLHVDVRFATNYSARQWGTHYQLVWVCVVPGSALERQLAEHNVRHAWLGRSLGLPADVTVPQ